MRRLTINALDDWLTLRATTHPDATALIAGREAVDYATLDARCARLARRLAARGVRAGDRVATTLPAGIEFAELLHALPKLGAVLLPLNTRLSASERRLLVEDAAPRLVVEDGLAGPEADVDLRTRVDPDEPQLVLYTSGTTARPKPVTLTYANNAASALASAWNIGVAPDDRWLCALPVFHVGGLQILIRSAVYGTAAVVHDRFDAAAVAGSLASGEVTLVSLVATMLARLRDAGLTSAPRLRAALIGGGPAPRPLLEWAHAVGLPVVQTYGMTETASQIATLAVDEALTKVGSTGRPLPGVQIRIEREEIFVRGPMVSTGALAEDGWLHTGDRGRLDDGYLYVEGRLKDVIVTGGENVAAPEVEEALLEHPAVRDAAVVGRPDAEWGEVVVAYAVVDDGISDGELRGHCGSRLAGYKVPKEIRRVDEIPRTASGKILKGRLRPLDPAA